jgi:hypothetical protein
MYSNRSARSSLHRSGQPDAFLAPQTEWYTTGVILCSAVGSCLLAACLLCYAKRADWQLDQPRDKGAVGPRALGAPLIDRYAAVGQGRVTIS